VGQDAADGWVYQPGLAPAERVAVRTRSQPGIDYHPSLRPVMPNAQVGIRRQPGPEDPFGHEVGIEHPVQAAQTHPVLLEALDLLGYVEFWCQ
jgi:hypothetical protein